MDVASFNFHVSAYLLTCCCFVCPFSWESYKAYIKQKKDFEAQLRNILYSLNLSNNFGVLAAVHAEAGMQEQREAILAYFFLHYKFESDDGNLFGHFVPRSPPELMKHELDNEIENWLHLALGVDINFEVCVAVASLRV